MHFQEFWHSCVQNKLSEISKNALSGIIGLLCAEQDVGNLKQNAPSEIARLQFAEQNVGNINSALSTFLGSGSQNTTSEISKNVAFVLLLGWAYVGD